MNIHDLNKLIEDSKECISKLEDSNSSGEYDDLIKILKKNNESLEKTKSYGLPDNS